MFRLIIIVCHNGQIFVIWPNGGQFGDPINHPKGDEIPWRHIFLHYYQLLSLYTPKTPQKLKKLHPFLNVNRSDHTLTKCGPGTQRSSNVIRWSVSSRPRHLQMQKKKKKKAEREREREGEINYARRKAPGKTPQKLCNLPTLTVRRHHHYTNSGAPMSRHTLTNWLVYLRVFFFLSTAWLRIWCPRKKEWRLWLMMLHDWSLIKGISRHCLCSMIFFDILHPKWAQWYWSLLGVAFGLQKSSLETPNSFSHKWSTMHCW